MLNQKQLDNLIRLSESWIKEIEVEASSLTLGETAFTGEVLLPWLQGKVSTLLKPELYVRGDGGPPVQPLIWEGITVFPDLTVVSAYEKYLAFEVKILRDGDPGERVLHGGRSGPALRGRADPRPLEMSAIRGVARLVRS